MAIRRLVCYTSHMETNPNVMATSAHGQFCPGCEQPADTLINGLWRCENSCTTYDAVENLGPEWRQIWNGPNGRNNVLKAERRAQA